MPLAVEMPVSVEENEAQDNDTVEENGGQVILVDDTNAVEAEGQQVDLDTKLGKALQQVLGDSEDLNRFDKLQRRLKVKKQSGKRLSRDEIFEYQRTMAIFHTRIVCTKLHLADQVKQLEREYFNTNAELPIGVPDYKHLVAKLGFVKKLLRKWKTIL